MLSIIPFCSKDSPKEGPSLSEEYVPYVPPEVRKATQTAAASRFPLLADESLGAPEPAVYTLETGYTVRATVKLEEVERGFSAETPMAMCHYVAPEGDKVYDIEACRTAMQENIGRERHNQFLVSVFNAFMKENDCRASAGKMTCPNAPPDLIKERLEAIKKLTSDVLGTTRKAIKYLAEVELYCGRDFDFDSALDKANDVAFTRTIDTRITETQGRIRVRLEGRKPTWWDGRSKCDESGCEVEWMKGKGHTFLTPEVFVGKSEPSVTSLQVFHERQPSAAEEESKPSVNPFETLFTGGEQLLLCESTKDS